MSANESVTNYDFFVYIRFRFMCSINTVLLYNRSMEYVDVSDEEVDFVEEWCGSERTYICSTNSSGNEADSRDIDSVGSYFTNQTNHSVIEYVYVSDEDVKVKVHEFKCVDPQLVCIKCHAEFDSLDVLRTHYKRCAAML